MTEVSIRRAVSTDLPSLMAFDHSCQTDYVWQMDVPDAEGQAGAIFRQVRLPRTISISYPRQVSALSETWNRRSGMLVALIADQPVGYLRLSDMILPRTAWITDVVTTMRYRRQGVALALILAAQSWAMDRKNTRALIEMSSKNYPAICLARKLGYEFCGYNDHYYYETQDIALFFGRVLR